MKIRRHLKAALMAVLCILPTASGCSRIDENVAEHVVIIPESSLSANQEFDNSRYIFSTLSEKEKEYYGLIREAAMNFEPVVIFPEKLETETLRKLFISVYYQEEEIFWLDSLFYRPDEASDALSLTYRFKKEEIPAMKAELDKKASEIFSAFDENTDDYEKLLYFHDYIVQSCAFSQDRKYVNTAYGVLVDGYAQCEGYAFAFDYLCSLAGIDCFTVNGTGSEGRPHAWNIVNLEGMWYHVDCTWDDPITNTGAQLLRYYYFLINDSDIIGVTHFPDDSYFGLPLCTSASNYYKREGLLASASDNEIEMLKKAAEAAAAKGETNFGIRFDSKRAYDSACGSLFDGKRINEVLAYVNTVSDKKVSEKKYIRYCDENQLIIHVAAVEE